MAGGKLPRSLVGLRNSVYRCEHACYEGDKKGGCPFGVPYCPQERYDEICEILDEPTCKRNYFAKAAYCTEGQNGLYAAYFDTCPDVWTAVGAWLGYASAAQAVATILVLQCFTTIRLIRISDEKGGEV